ncbi:phage holin family protein [Ketogulonicigenium vulgare]|uniref:Holin-X, holin superfamily III n=1 Tax=Ketogulonicigenium vulgare (strain WSH-001) TaxID=759362 RepID=F9Y7D6_KETVW|nr:phage holin family protein [Ketogulonicigenium vulgare]ADO42877.1 conserved hypothetical protein [Ketogulonicigenium vulgare Y25]AEM41064.1 hypothetical protein KVU_1225 [Ketogulonicigenium vulgare WSH-001]ALJ81209.1 hypothetical protein KVH_08475 [Ketogulonicigenium vulgare]ANW33950.1 hypothetical protein KvSKV_08445 [Ketogulonicigenium vulgare]AOZ54790.1 hypothetical protein KVC_1777 [Ketogulonicigenium vulgare]
MFSKLEARIEAVTRRSLLAFLAVISILVGLAFLTVAGWIAIADMASPLVAALVLAAVWVIGGGVFLLMSSNDKPAEPAPPPAPAVDPTMAIISAFLSGFTAGNGRHADRDRDE